MKNLLIEREELMIKNTLENKQRSKRNAAMIVGQREYSGFDKHSLKKIMRLLIIEYGVTEVYSDAESPLARETAKIMRGYIKLNPDSQIKHYIVLPRYKAKKMGKSTSDNVVFVTKWVSRVPENLPSMYQYMADKCGYAVFCEGCEDCETYYVRMYAEKMHLKIFNVN